MLTNKIELKFHLELINDTYGFIHKQLEILKKSMETEEPPDHKSFIENNKEFLDKLYSKISHHAVEEYKKSLTEY